MTINSTSEREERRNDDELVRTVLRPVRGCATDSQYSDVYDRLSTAFTTIRQEERRTAFKDAVTLIQRKYRFTTFARVTEVVDLLEAAANQTREDGDDGRSDR